MSRGKLRDELEGEGLGSAADSAIKAHASRTPVAPLTGTGTSGRQILHSSFGPAMRAPRNCRV
jgi:hypothetical protein